MYRFFLSGLICLLVLPLKAQNQEFDLARCIDYAIQNAITVQNSKLDERYANAKVRETTGLGLPQISGNVSIGHNQQLRRFFTAYSPNSFFFGGQSVPGLNDGDVVSANNFFQLKSSGDAGVNISQLIFSGSYFVGLQASQALRELSVKNTNQKTVDLVEQVTKGYYLVLINRERINLFDKNISRLDTLLRNTIQLQEQGFAELIDVDRLRVALNNLHTEREKFNGLLALSVELLKFQMNYPMDSPLTVTGDITTLEPSRDINNYTGGVDYERRPEYQVLQVNEKLQRINLKYQYSQAIPSIVAIGNLGYATQSPDLMGLFQTNTNLADNGQFGPDSWYAYKFFGLNISVPLFSGTQRAFKIQQEKINLMKIENGMKQLRAGVDLEARQAMISYRNGISGMAAQKQNIALAENIAKVAQIKYEQGLGSNLEVIDAETSLKESQINFYNALYDALVARVNLDKAYGNLYDVNK